MGQTLRDWYQYLEKQMRVSLREEQRAAPGPDGQPVNPTPSPDPRVPPTDGLPSTGEGGVQAGDLRSLNGAPESRGAAGGSQDRVHPAVQAAALRRKIRAAVQQSPLPIELGPAQRRRGGRKPITETREEIIRRLLDPELTLYEAAAVLDLSRATVRRYTDHGRLECLRTGGGQRRFRLSVLLGFLDRQAAARGEA